MAAQPAQTIIAPMSTPDPYRDIPLGVECAWPPTDADVLLSVTEQGRLRDVVLQAFRDASTSGDRGSTA